VELGAEPMPEVVTLVWSGYNGWNMVGLLNKLFCTVPNGANDRCLKCPHVLSYQPVVGTHSWLREVSFHPVVSVAVVVVDVHLCASTEGKQLACIPFLLSGVDVGIVARELELDYPKTNCDQ